MPDINKVCESVKQRLWSREVCFGKIFNKKPNYLHQYVVVLIGVI